MPRVSRAGVAVRGAAAGPRCSLRSVLLGVLAAAAASGGAAPAGAEPRPLPARVVGQFAPAGALFARGAEDSGYVALAALAERALAAGDDTLRVAAQFELGARLAWFGHYARAIPPLRDARARARALRDSTRWVQSSQWLAFALNSTGGLAEGGSLARATLPAALALGDHRAEAYLRLSAAFAALRAGRAAEAIRGYRRALPMFDRQRDEFGACEALLGLGRSYEVSGPRDSARALFRRAAVRAELAHQARGAASAWNNLASHVYLDGDPEAALESWRRAALVAQSAGDLETTVSATVNVLLALSDLGRADDALALADSLLARVERAGSADGIARVRSRIALLELKRGRTDAAARQYRAALALLEHGDTGLRAQCLSGLVRTLFARDSAAAALALYRRAAAELSGRLPPALERDLLQAGAFAALHADSLAAARTIAQRTLSALRTSGLARDDLGAERVLALVAARTGRLAEAREHLRRAELALRRQGSDVTGLEWRTHLGNPIALGATWGEVELDRDGGRRRDHIAGAFAAFERLRSSLLLELAAGPGGRAAPLPAVTLEQAQRSVLRPRELLLLAWTGREGGWLLAVTRDTAACVPLAGDAALARDTGLLRDALAAVPPLEPATLERMLSQAGAGLLGPLVPLLRRCGSVIVVPSGPLQRTPFEALRLPLGPGGADAPLGVTHVLARAPSASLLALARSRPTARRREPALLAFANPRGPGGRTLPGALAEVRWLEARYRGVRVLDPPRDDETALRAMAAAPVVHVAAHAAFDPISPWRSSLALAPGDPVRARDLLMRPLRAELVVLSACETAGGSSGGTGGMEGLSAALLCAGARAVIATLWPVNDRAARRFATAFYEEAERAPDAGTALVRARARLRAGGAGPYDWAAFTLVGDPGSRIQLARRSLPIPGF
ncbi:MAG: CHAT domain-containing protein [Candidatus Eisenbacteria bacterium]|nr:CHAT domain-containing protein [Candidatus Eisenbacteria bacterium]